MYPFLQAVGFFQGAGFVYQLRAIGCGRAKSSFAEVQNEWDPCRYTIFPLLNAPHIGRQCIAHRRLDRVHDAGRPGPHVPPQQRCRHRRGEKRENHEHGVHIWRQDAHLQADRQKHKFHQPASIH